jgi:hypothetical protein
VRRSRLTYCTLSAALVILALASRRFGPHLPTLVAAYAGDILWALMVYVALGAVWPSASPGTLAGIALALAYLTECSQLYQAPWIRSIRDTGPGGLLLGHGFLWSDIACYTLGVVIGWVGERLALSRRARAAPPTTAGSPPRVGSQ